MNNYKKYKSKALNLKNFNWTEKTILIVEDTPSSNLYFEAVLSPTNAVLLWAENGKEAFDICDANKDIDIVLMDLRMPVMSGFTAIEKIREIRPKLPIIAQSAYLNSEEEKLSFEAGCNDFISKPVDVKTLLRTINQHINY